MSILDSNGLQIMKTRLDMRGGASQQARMIKDKRSTLDKAVLYSYQGAQVQKIGAPELAPALINPNKVLQDYDEKTLSIGFEYGYSVGDVFEWANTGTKWLIYLQDLTELAYFKGDIRRCSYAISWDDDAGVRHTTYAAIKGPTQNKISSIQRSGFSMDIPNYTINLLLPQTKEVLEQFQRYSKFYLKGISGPDSDICWRVEALDCISTPGILEVYANEYYANDDTDDIEAGIVGGLIIDPSTEEIKSQIIGDTFIKPKKFYTFSYSGSDEAVWGYNNKLPMEVEVNGKEIRIKWNTTYGGQFDLSYGDSKRTIVVDSLF